MEADESLAYVAGFFDGEGCLLITKNGVESSVVAQITNSDEYVIHYINALLPGRIYNQKRYGRKKIYRLVWSGDEAINTIELLLPYLVIKKVMADLILEYYSRLSKVNSPFNDSSIPTKELRDDYRLRLLTMRKNDNDR